MSTPEEFNLEQSAVILKNQAAQIAEMEESIQSLQNIVNMLLKQSREPQIVPVDPIEFSREEVPEIFITDEGRLQSASPSITQIEDTEFRLMVCSYSLQAEDWSSYSKSE
ncbi:uncharacterized protein PGTG_20510 [Puccinia graminis f. sp. tritici CRL 75-36-700-3]|uniref:Uncharacterized protein n=1 Tax=Puccinia graminis f. sp. tritici (strain CRL 75-36-700-3 / race SCCL) TaxID=418459 RepID=E3NYA5_PUCGT|nr:uncharacterized protein PGTG_20510 [Puccinia graminis f. sp. tritici CRL 75-36-700-3]EFP94554.1 hypothetical protein PGTG_20510 [Puccinia graminis f. sp. tritici CRL 75-36-700-3]